MKNDEDLDEVKNVFITKYALTKGIYEIKAIIYKDTPGMIRDYNSSYFTFYHNKEWHLTEADAIKEAEQMRDKKMLSLDAQIKKIASIKFDIKRLEGK